MTACDRCSVARLYSNVRGWAAVFLGMPVQPHLGKGLARMSITSTTAHARGRKLAIAALLTLGLALPLSGTAPAAQNSQFTFPGLGGKNQNQDTDDTCPNGQMSPGGQAQFGADAGN